MKKTRLAFSVVGLCLLLLTVAGCGGDNNNSSAANDTTPKAFSFTSPPGTVPLDTLVTSDTITVAGVTEAPISITGGTYSINGMDFSTSAGPVRNGDTVTVQHMSASTISTLTETILTIGNRSATFSSTTVAVDLVPDAFTFTPQSAVALNTLVTSNSITVAGLTPAATAPISVSGGAYSLDSGVTYITTPGTVANGATVTVQHTASANPGTLTETILTIGGVSGSFISNTLRSGSMIYDADCASCHTLATYDTLPLNTAGDLAGLDNRLGPIGPPLVIIDPAIPTHPVINLTTDEIAALAAFISPF